jgi:hypothetical protein
MPLWRIRYEDRYQRQRSYYHDSFQRPSNSEAEAVVKKELNGSRNGGNRQMSNAPSSTTADAEVTVFAVDEVTQ